MSITGGVSPRALPFIPGVEGAGIVEAIGPGVTRFERGARVAYALLLWSCGPLTLTM